MNLTDYATVTPIIIICYLVGLGLKACEKVKDNYIPMILGLVGGIIAIPAMKIMSDFPAQDIITAISVGIFSGLASTGVNQVWKQIKKDD